MALKSKSLFLYGLQVTTLNRNLDFVIESGGPVFTAVLRLGFYSLTALMAEIEGAMNASDLDNFYKVTADRSVNGGTENRITIQTDGDYLELRFGTGPSLDVSVAPLIGFTAADRTGSLSYTSSVSAGTRVVNPIPGNNWVDPDHNKKTNGVVNNTASGKREAIVYSVQRFWQIQFVWIPQSQIAQWSELLTWLTSQKPIDFTPEISNPNVFYEGTLESTSVDGNGLSFMLSETPKGTGLYDTGLLKFRVKE